MSNIRNELISVALKWQILFGVAPGITSSISEYDAALLVGCSLESYSSQMQKVTAVRKGFDFELDGKKYQVKANRPSGKQGSKVTLVKKPSNYDWDYLIWILYDSNYKMQEAYRWKRNIFRKKFENVNRLSPTDIRNGEKLFSIENE